MFWKNFLILAFSVVATLPSMASAKQHLSSIEKAVKSTPSSQCFFTPPQGWEISDPKNLSSRIKIAFIKNTGKGFCPSINLATEETSTSLNDYLKAVKAIHEQDRNNQWRALGKVNTTAGLAQLTQIDSTTEWGPIRILQLIFMKEGKAYVLTAAALKEEFSDYYKEIQTAFRSLTLSSDLLAHIPQLERREVLKQTQTELIEAAKKTFRTPKKPLDTETDPVAIFNFNDRVFQEKHWLPFQQAVVNNFNDMGAYWQVLVLKNTQEQLLYSNLTDPSAQKLLEEVKIND